MTKARRETPRLGRRICAALLVLSACAYPIRTRYDADPAADFTGYRNYAWVCGCMKNGLVGGEGFAVDVSVIEALAFGLLALASAYLEPLVMRLLA